MKKLFLSVIASLIFLAFPMGAFAFSGQYSLASNTLHLHVNDYDQVNNIGNCGGNASSFSILLHKAGYNYSEINSFAFSNIYTYDPNLFDFSYDFPDGNYDAEYIYFYTGSNSGLSTCYGWNINPINQLFTLPFTPFSISGNIFHDNNHNGIKDSGETNVQGATVTLSNDSKTSAVTDVNGNYSFANLNVGTYTDSLTLPVGYGATTSNNIIVSNNIDTTVNYGITTTTKVKLLPSADAFINANNPTINYGSVDKLSVSSSPVKMIFLRYNLSNLAGKTIVAADFKATTYTGINAVSNGPDDILIANNSWNEATLNYNNQPGFSSTDIGTMTNMTSPGTHYTFSLDSTAIQPYAGSHISLGIISSADPLSIFSKEALNQNNSPKLILEYY